MKFINIVLFLFVSSLAQAESIYESVKAQNFYNVTADQILYLPYGSKVSFVYKKGHFFSVIQNGNEEKYPETKVKNGFEITFLGSRDRCSFLSVNLKINQVNKHGEYEEYVLCTKPVN